MKVETRRFNGVCVSKSAGEATHRTPHDAFAPLVAVWSDAVEGCDPERKLVTMISATRDAGA